MDSNKFEEFRQKAVRRPIEKRMTVMDAKLSFINKGFNEFQPRPRWTEFKDFQQEMTGFIARRGRPGEPWVLRLSNSSIMTSGRPPRDLKRLKSI